MMPLGGCDQCRCPAHDFFIDFGTSPPQTEGVFAEDQKFALAVIASL
jgi:hypothetical protein